MKVRGVGAFRGNALNKMNDGGPRVERDIICPDCGAKKARACTGRKKFCKARTDALKKILGIKRMPPK